MIYDDFQNTVWPSERWSRFQRPDCDVWDPATKVDAGDGCLTINLERITAAHPYHMKAMLLSATSFDIEHSRSFRLRAEMAVRTFGTDGNRFGLDSGDPRLVAGALVTVDRETGLVFDFMVSNDRIAPLYERLPGAPAAGGTYPAFTTLGEPQYTDAQAWHQYEVRYDGCADHVEWWLDGRCIAERDHVGAPLGSKAPAVKYRRLRFGGGVFTLLSDLADDREAANDHPRTPGVIRSNLHDGFGQGAEVRFRRFEIEL
jgi:hypothetical protein